MEGTETTTRQPETDEIVGYVVNETETLCPDCFPLPERAKQFNRAYGITKEDGVISCKCDKCGKEIRYGVNLVPQQETDETQQETFIDPYELVSPGRVLLAETQCVAYELANMEDFEDCCGTEDKRILSEFEGNAKEAIFENVKKLSVMWEQLFNAYDLLDLEKSALERKCG